MSIITIQKNIASNGQVDSVNTPVLSQEIQELINKLEYQTYQLNAKYTFKQLQEMDDEYDQECDQWEQQEDDIAEAKYIMEQKKIEQEESLYRETKQEEIERLLKETDDEWTQYLDQYNNAKAKAPKPTEKEMDSKLQEYYALLDDDKKMREQQEQDRQNNLENIMCRWFEDHPESKIPINGTFEDQWKVYCEEEAHQKAIDVAENAKKEREAAKVRSKNAKKVAKKKAAARHAAKIGLNNQAARKRDYYKKKAIAYKQKITESKANGTYKGKRVQRKIKQEKERKETQVKVAQGIIVPAPTVCYQPEIEEPKTECEIDGEDKKKEEEEEMFIMPQVVKDQLKPDIVKEDDNKDDDFINGMLAVQGKSKISKVSKSTSPKPKRRKRGKVVLNVDLGQGIIKQAQEKRKQDDVVYKRRCNAFETLGNKKVQEKVFVRTKMCNSVKSNKPCRHGKRCRFAHNVSELTIRECRFGEGCRFVKSDIVKGCVNNVGKAGRVCEFKHPSESTSQYYQRMGIKTSTDEKKKAEPLKLTLPSSRPVSQPTHKTQIKKAPIAPWSKSVGTLSKPQSVKPTVTARKTRWGPPHVNTESIKSPTVKSTPKKRKTRWDVKPIKVIRVPKHLFKQAINICIEQQTTDVKIEVY